MTFVHVCSPDAAGDDAADARARSKLMSERRPQGGELAAAISNSVVKELARATGRGPTKARTTLGENAVFVVLQDTLTRGEQTLADTGGGNAVLDLRRRWRRVMETQMPTDCNHADKCVPHFPRAPTDCGLRTASGRGGFKWSP